VSHEEEIRAALPPRPRGIPQAAWADLCAEIEDHLHEAYDEALVSDAASAGDALGRALDDLGDPPNEVVRRLWWESLGGQWLRAWVQTISIVILVTVVTIVSVRLFQEFRAVAREGRAMLSAIPEDLSTQFFVWRKANIELRRGGEDGALVADVPVRLFGRPFKHDHEWLHDRTDAGGSCTIGPIRVGQYHLEVSDTELGIDWSRNLLLYPEEDNEILRFTLPDHRPTRFRLVAPVAALNAAPALLVELDVLPEMKSPWVASLSVAIDDAGMRVAIREDNRDLPDVSDRVTEWLYQPRLYSFETGPQDALELPAGAALDVVSVRILDQYGVASSRRLPIGGERRYVMEADTLNTFNLSLDSEAVLALAEAPALPEKTDKP
jgi:hypothetical protein